VGNNNTVSSFNQLFTATPPIPDTSCFVGSIGGLRPNPPGHTEMSLPQMLGLSHGNTKPYKTLEEFRQALDRWLQSLQQLYPNDNNRHLCASRYITRTLGFGYTHGLTAALNYHWSAVQASMHTPPQFDFMNGDLYLQGYLTHILAVDKTAAGASYNSVDKPRTPSSSFNRNRARPTKAIAGMKHERSSDSDKDCKLHPGKGHANSECFQQGAKRPRQSPSSG